MHCVSGAWEGASPSKGAEEKRGGLSRLVRTRPLIGVQNELPGSIQDLKEEVHHEPCNVHNTHLDQANNAGEPTLASIKYI